MNNYFIFFLFFSFLPFYRKRDPPPEARVSCKQPTDGGDGTSNDYDWQHIHQVFTEVHVCIQQVFMGVPEISNEFSRE